MKFEDRSGSRSQTKRMARIVASSSTRTTSLTFVTPRTCSNISSRSASEQNQLTFCLMVGNVKNPVAVNKPSQIVLVGLTAFCHPPVSIER